MTRPAGSGPAPSPGPLPHEAHAAWWSGAMFFCLLAGYFVLRPVRDLMGVRVGGDALDELFFATLLATLALAPVFGRLVSRWSRRRFIPWAYRAFAVQVVAFGAWAAVARGDGALVFAKTYFVWLSVFNLFVVSVFWGFMADVWRPEAARRVYGRIAIGGTAGALAGSFVGLGLRQVPAAFGASRDEVAAFLPVLFVAAALLVEAAVRCMRRVAGAAAALGAPPAAERPVGGRAWDGVVVTTRSPFLAGIAGYVLLYSVTSTILYFARVDAVERSDLTQGQRADLFFWSEIAVQALTLGLQATGTARLLALVGVGGALAVAPLVVAVGCVALVAAPGLGMAVALVAIGRVAHFAFAKPAAESLYTVVPRGEKYKAKSFLDTFVYRAGDGFGAAGARVVRAALHPGVLPAAALPLCGAAVVLAPFLARAAARRRAATALAAPAS